MSRDRLLVIDEDLTPRVATYLMATRSPIGHLPTLREFTDPLLLRELANRPGLRRAILVTGNDGMPAEHGDVLQRLGATVATIDPAVQST